MRAPVHSMLLSFKKFLWKPTTGLLYRDGTIHFLHIGVFVGLLRVCATNVQPFSLVSMLSGLEAISKDTRGPRPISKPSISRIFSSILISASISV
jgi:hypothetical protein